MTTLRRLSIPTSHCTFAVEETGSSGIPLLLIHGNSSCRRVFSHQFHQPIGGDRRVIAFDLPGHGESSYASDPGRTYTLPGLADAIVELLAGLDVPEVIVLGWSLGGGMSRSNC